MKKIMLFLATSISTVAFSQQADKHAAFNLEKKSIVLTTGITMNYIEKGNAEGTPLIFLHGVTDTGRSFQLTIEELTRINPHLRIIAPDLRGHGQSSMPDETTCVVNPEQCFTPAAFASDIIALMDQKHISKAHLVGHSMGSVIAQELALNYANRVSSMVLIGTFVNGKECGSIHEFMIGTMIEGQLKPALQKNPTLHWPQDAYKLTPNDLGPAVTTFIKENWVAELATNKTFLEAVYQETIQIPVGTWIGGMRALGEVDTRERMAHLQVPTLVLYATQDMLFPQPDQQQVKACLQTASQRYGTKIIYKTYGKIPLPASGYQENDLGHNLQWAAPKQVAADVYAFTTSGFPMTNLTFINPKDAKQVITEESKANILSFGQKE